MIIISQYKERKSPFIHPKNNTQQNVAKNRRFRARKSSIKTIEEVYPHLVDEAFDKVWGEIKNDKW